MNVSIVPCHFDNYAYIISDKRTGDAAVIDPCESWPVLKALSAGGLNPQTIFCTHHHQDHIGGLADIRGEYPDADVCAFKGDRSRIPGTTVLVDDGDAVQAGSLVGTVLHTPGHTTGSVVYAFGDLLFTGDTLFGAGCGRLFEGNPGQMMHSLQKIAAYGENTRLYFGHEYTMTNLRFSMQVEPENEAVQRRYEMARETREQGMVTTPSTIAEELMTNPFLRCGEPGVIEYLKKNGYPADGSDPVQVFSLIREMRNGFS